MPAIDVQGVQGVQGRCAGVKTMHGVACAGRAGFKSLTRVRTHARRLFLNFQVSYVPCTPCTPCTCFSNQVVISFLTLHTALHTLHSVKMSKIMDKKRQQWERIKDQAPDVAEWLLAMASAFGKPAGMVVELASGEVIESGVVSQALRLHSDKVKK